MKCVVCGKKKQEWLICRDCFELLTIKYPEYRDFVRAIKRHKKLGVK